jgi:Zn-dependent protease
MFGLPSIRLGRPFGIPLEVDASWLFVFFLVAATLTTSYFPSAVPDEGPAVYTALGLLTSIVFFGSLVLHELAHSIMARAGGLSVSRVTLFVFGGVSQIDDEPSSPGREFLMALAGPATSLVLAGLFWGASVLAAEAGASALLLVPLEYLAVINGSLALFNLLPGFPLDGGRVLRSVLWEISGDQLKATKWASRSGQAIGTILMAIAVFGVLSGDFDFIWLAVMGWFISNLAAAAYRQQVTRSHLAELPVSAIMSTPPVLAPADLSLEEMSHTYFLAGRHTRYPVVQDGHVIGLIDIERSSDVPREQWPTTTVAEVASKNLEDVVVAPTASVVSVLSRLEPGGPGAVLVVEDGRLAGIVTRSDVIRLIMDMTRGSALP